MRQLISEVAKQRGVDPNYLHKIAEIESNLDPSAVSPTGATGLFQFTKGTGKQYGLFNGGTDLRTDPQASADAAARLTIDNQKALSSAGVPVDDVSTYLAHQLGAAGATELYQAAESGGQVSPELAKAMGLNFAQSDPELFDPQQYIDATRVKFGETPKRSTMTLSEYRKKYPEFSENYDDTALLDVLYKDYGKGLSYDDFAQKMKYSAKTAGADVSDRGPLMSLSDYRGRFPEYSKQFESDKALLDNIYEDNFKGRIPYAVIADKMGYYEKPKEKGVIETAGEAVLNGWGDSIRFVLGALNVPFAATAGGMVGVGEAKQAGGGVVDQAVGGAKGAYKSAKESLLGDWENWGATASTVYEAARGVPLLADAEAVVGKEYAPVAALTVDILGTILMDPLLYVNRAVKTARGGGDTFRKFIKNFATGEKPLAIRKTVKDTNAIRKLIAGAKEAKASGNLADFYQYAKEAELYKSIEMIPEIKAMRLTPQQEVAAFWGIKKYEQLSSKAKRYVREKMLTDVPALNRYLQESIALPGGPTARKAAAEAGTVGRTPMEVGPVRRLALGSEVPTTSEQGKAAWAFKEAIDKRRVPAIPRTTPIEDAAMASPARGVVPQSPRVIQAGPVEQKALPQAVYGPPEPGFIKNPNAIALPSKTMPIMPGDVLSKNGTAFASRAGAARAASEHAGVVPVQLGKNTWVGRSIPGIAKTLEVGKRPTTPTLRGTLGGVAGIEQDEDGNWKWNAAKGAAGVLAAAAGLKYGPKALPKLRRAYEVAADVLDIEGKYRRIGAPKVGSAIKNLYNTMTFHEERGIEFAKKFMRFGYSKEDMPFVVMAAENPKVLSQMPRDVAERLRPGVAMLRNFFDDAMDAYRARGVNTGFYENVRQRMADDIAALEAKLRQPINLKKTAAAAKRRGEIQSQISALKTGIERSKDLKFVHVPIAAWFDSTMKNSPDKAAKILKLFFSQKRKTLSIKDLVDSGAVAAADIHPLDIVKSYSRRMGRDIGLLDIVNAAKKEGLATRDAQLGATKGWSKAPIARMPLLGGNYIEPTLHKALSEMTAAKEFNWWSRPMAAVKGFAFYNPLFLPMYDMVQAAMLGSARLHGAGVLGGGLYGAKKGYEEDGWKGAGVGAAVGALTGLAGAEIATKGRFIKGFRSALSRDADYWQAFEKGLFSKPFNNPYKEFSAIFDDIKNKHTGVLGSFRKGMEGLKKDRLAMNALKFVTPNKNPIITELYSLSHRLAWQLDEGVRMASYKYLRDTKSFTPREAAEIAARFHGDYASVPAKTRRMLNNIFFTPTFKIAMGKTYKEMIESTLKGGLVRGDKRSKQFAQALLSTAAIQIGFDQFMTNGLGFDRDEFGRRYVRTVETTNDEGQPVTKDVVLTLSNPANMFTKYWSRMKGAVRSSRGPVEAAADFARRNLYEIHPVYRIAGEVFSNDNGNGQQIYDPLSDSGMEQIAKSALYAATHGVALLEQLGLGPSIKKDKTALRTFQNHFSKTLEYAVRPFTFIYARDPESRQIVYRLKSLQRELNTGLSRGTVLDTKKAINNYKQKVKLLLDQLKEAKEREKKSLEKG